MNEGAYGAYNQRSAGSCGEGVLSSVQSSKQYYAEQMAAAKPQGADRVTIPEVLNRQDAEIEQLEKAFATFIDRIAPVLTPRPPDSTKGLGDQQPIAINIRHRIEQNTRQIARIHAALLHVMDRVEL